MRIQLIVKIDGLRNGERWPAVGGIIDLPASEATNMIAHGYAIPAPVPQVQERATAEPIIERATLPTTQPKRRKGKA
jgi:hypothetical protein